MKKSIALLSLLMLGASSFNAVATDKKETKETKKETETVTLKEVSKEGLKTAACLGLLFVYYKFVEEPLKIDDRKDATGKTAKKALEIPANAICLIQAKAFGEKLHNYLCQGKDSAVAFITQ